MDEPAAAPRPRRRRILLVALALILAAALAVSAAFRLSPWPSVLLIRRAFDADSARVQAALARHVPGDIVAQLDQRYDPSDPDAVLDLYRPAAAQAPLRTIVWAHGGAYVSGGKGQVGNWCRILAGRGFAVISVGYSIAPGRTYPVPLRQVNAALAWLRREAGRLGVDPAQLVLAGDSAGAHIAAQVANLVSEPAYARLLGIEPAITRRDVLGVLLFCGPYDVGTVDLDGSFGGFMRTVLWAYSGTRSFADDPVFATASVPRYVTASFPPAFISAGNADPLLPQSRAFAETLAGLGVRVETLFFPADHRPPLGHEYQFDLDGAAGREALERAVRFVSELQPTGAAPAR